MNYRHAFHAGSFADVVKHAVLARIVAHVKEKPAAFRVIDTHAGAGLYDLAGPEASRTGEWREGIGKLVTAAIEPAARQLLAPYLDAVAAFNAGPHKLNPGSPVLLQHWLLAQDRLTACERDPNAARALAARLRGDRRAKAIAIDGYTALNAYVPPKERRGLVLIDPAFERTGEFVCLASGIEAAHRKWPSGIYLLWYPIKEQNAPGALARRLRRCGIAKILRAELSLGAPRAPDRLGACGLIVVNPPYTLENDLRVLLPAFADHLGDGSGGHRLDWLAGEK